MLVSILWLLGENKQRTLPGNRDDFLTIGVAGLMLLKFLRKHLQTLLIVEVITEYIIYEDIFLVLSP